MRRPESALIALVLFTGCATLGARPGSAPRHTEVGLASYLDSDFHGRVTSSGAVYDERRLTAAHRTLPFGTRVKVTNLANHRSVIVTITDRGPFRRGRIIDVSRRAAIKLGFLTQGTARVRLKVLRG